MDVPRPTAAPPGRLVRLGVVLDTRNPIERLLEVARMCDRAGIGALWVEDLADDPGAAGAGAVGAGSAAPASGADPGAGGAARLDAWTALALLAGEVRRARIGAVLDAAAWPPARLARMAATLGALTGGRLELTLRAAGPEAAAAVRALREALAATTVPAALAGQQGAGDGAAGPAALAATGPAYGAVALPAEVPTIGVQLQPDAPTDPDEAPTPAAPGQAAAPGAAAEVVAVVDDLVLPAAPLAATLAAAAAARQAAARSGRDPRTVGVAATLPVSVGRTFAEAQARWEAEPAFAALGASEQAGLFGTLEQCHDRLVALAHAGVSDLRCLLPNAIDIHDVIAQLTAMTIGTADKLVPGAPRTRVPEPPTGWGGRSRFPRPS
jgi:alkanesulfonate monooxygenase SsuD/methylene tetrahydromethanopterin reductase-like flavin-dependent oxidoreductase (luciferase family)